MVDIVQCVNLPSLLLYDCSERRMVVDQFVRHLFPPASLAKIMTLLLVAEKIGDDPSQAGLPLTLPGDPLPGSNVRRFQPDGAVPIGTCLRAAATISSNEAAHALALWHSGAIGAFVDAMNVRAQALGMFDTHFTCPTGLKSTARTNAVDMLTLARAVMATPRCFSQFGHSFFCWNGRRESATNSYLRTTAGVDGLKTGFLKNVTANIVLTMLFRQRRYIAIVLGAQSIAARNSSVEQLLEIALKTSDDIPNA